VLIGLGFDVFQVELVGSPVRSQSKLIIYSFLFSMWIHNNLSIVSTIVSGFIFIKHSGSHWSS